MIHLEFGYGNEPDGLQAEIPGKADGISMFFEILLLGQSSLIDDRITCVEQGTILKERLSGILHLHDKFISAARTAGYIKHGRPIIFCRSKMFCRKKNHIFHFLVIQDMIQEGYQNILTLFTAENTFEHVVVDQIGVSVLRYDDFIYIRHDHLD